jgi:hypothetical protein
MARMKRVDQDGQDEKDLQDKTEPLGFSLSRFLLSFK